MSFLTSQRERICIKDIERLYGYSHRRAATLYRYLRHKKHEKLKAADSLTELNRPLFVDDLAEAMGISRETIKASLVD